MFVLVCMCVCTTSRSRGVCGLACRPEFAEVATGSLVHSAARRPEFCVTRLLPPASPQSPEQRRTSQRYQ